MYALGHFGIAVGLAWLLTFRRPGPIDFRLVLLGALLPDLIDKPLGALLGLEARLWAHTLLFLAAVLVLSRFPRTRWLTWVGFGVAVHLLVDLIWGQPNVALWPLYGFAFHAGEQSFGAYWQTFLTDRYVQFGEITGTIILATLAWTHGLRSWSALGQFLWDGKLVRPAQSA